VPAGRRVRSLASRPRAAQERQEESVYIGIGTLLVIVIILLLILLL
jgi:hypothetical protein